MKDYKIVALDRIQKAYRPTDPYGVEMCKQLPMALIKPEIKQKPFNCYYVRLSQQSYFLFPFSSFRLASIDALTIPSRCGKGVLRRVTEVFDCWFESGSMPYAQVHYPFENRKEFEDTFPADFIAEGIDQTRGW